MKSTGANRRFQRLLVPLHFLDAVKGQLVWQLLVVLRKDPLGTGESPPTERNVHQWIFGKSKCNTKPKMVMPIETAAIGNRI
jgi:hypothetical protein